MKSAAEPVGFAVFLGFVMLLAILMEPVVARDRLVGVLLWRALGFFAAAMPAVQAFDELGVCLVAVLSLRVVLRPLLPSFRICHVHPRWMVASDIARPLR